MQKQKLLWTGGHWAVGHWAALHGAVTWVCGHAGRQPGGRGTLEYVRANTSNDELTMPAHPQPSEALRRAEQLILEIPDHPAPGILFRDIMPLLADGEALKVTVDAMIAPFLGTFDAIAGLEARGFLLASAAAYASGTGLIPVRKSGKLPRAADKIDYSLEYGVAAIEAHSDLPRGSRVLIIDDVLATGGTLAAAHELLGNLGYQIAGSAVLFEIDGLGGRETVGDPTLHTVFHNAH